MTGPAPDRAPIERKVTAATIAATIVGILVTVLNAAEADASLLGGLPAWVQHAVTLIAPPLATFWAGWRARHTPRTDTAAR